MESVFRSFTLLMLTSFSILIEPSALAANGECLDAISSSRRVRQIRPEAARKRMIELNSFYTKRTLEEYDRNFDGKLVLRLLALAKTGGHWVDMGAGSARAQIAFFQTPIGKTIQYTAFGYSIPERDRTAVRQLTRRYKGQFRYLEGWFSEDRLGQIGKADIITDVFGIFNYAAWESKEQVLEQYIAILNPGGMIFLEESVRDQNWLSKFLNKYPEITIENGKSANGNSYSLIQRR